MRAWDSAAERSSATPTGTRPCWWSPSERAASVKRRRQVARQLLTQGHARAVEPRLDRGDRLAEDLGRLFVGQLLDFPQDQHGPIGLGQLINGAREDAARLTVEELRFGSPGPVGQQIRAVTFPVAVFFEGREVFLEPHLELGPLAAPLEQGRIGRHAVYPGAEGRAPLEAVDLARQGEED